jgi:hypothetical protein
MPFKPATKEVGFVKGSIFGPPGTGKTTLEPVPPSLRGAAMKTPKRTETEQKVEELSQQLKKLTDRHCCNILFFVCGWCKDDKEFAEGLARAIHSADTGKVGA